MPPRPNSVKISYSPDVAACSRVATTDHGDASEEPATVGADGSILSAAVVGAVELTTVIAVPQTPHKRSPAEMALLQLGHVDVVAGVIE